MITLPKDWKDNIQTRDWIKPFNKYGEVCLLILVVKNQDGQVFMYQEPVDAEIQGSSVNGMDTFSTGIVTTQDPEVKEKTLHNAYMKFIYHVPAIVAQQDTAISYKDGEQYESITNNEWEIMQLEGLTIYKAKA